MKNKSLVFVIIVLFIGLIECDGLELNVPDEVVFVIGEKETKELGSKNFTFTTESDFEKFELTCSGDKPVQLITYNMKVWPQIFDHTSVLNDSIYYSTIMFRGAYYTITGYYNCSYIGEEGGDSKSTYIYVHYLKNGGAFLRQIVSLSRVKVYLGEPMRLDCRTKRPDIEVILYVNDIKVSRFQYKFDPRVGVILEDLIGFLNQTSIEEIKCQNNYNNAEYLTFKPEISLRKPFIENNNSSDYFFGGEIALNCSMFMNEKYKPDFKWILPNINAIRELKEFRNRGLFISILIIKNASLSDSGQYVCTVSVLNLLESNTTKNIEIHEKMAPWVLSDSNVSLEGTVILVKSPFPFFIACYVKGRPKPKITWLKDGENIDEIIENNFEVSLRDDNQILEFKFARTKYAGKYECSIENKVGHIQPFTNVIIEDEALALSEKNLRISIVSIIIILIISFSVVIFLAIKIKKKKNIRNDMLQFELFLFQEGKADKLNKECTIEEQAELLPYDHSYEVEREKITLGKQLGAGAFGRVLMAQVKGLNGKESPTRVAIKMCKFGYDKAHLRALILELKIMIHLGKHLNIVNLLGAHTSNIDKGELWILAEYCKYGNLLKFIQRAKAKFINQIDPITSDIDVGRTSPFPKDPLSPKSLRCSIGYGRTSNFNPDAYLDSHSEGSMEIGQSMGGHPSTTSNTRLTTEKISFCNSSAPPSGGRRYELPPADRTPRKESSISDSDYDFTYHLFLNSDMIEYSQPPSSPTSPSTSECQEKTISSDSENIPGVSAPLTTTDLLCWAWQVANGMEYLTSRKVIHGDIAARNLLLAENNVVKICDFGLSREMYKNYVYLKKSSDAMPIKWMAPEAIEQKIFSTQSDVWSYGVTLWEMFTLGNTPFPGVPLNKFATALEKGMRLEKPRYCNDQIYSLLLHCWRSNPLERPRFCQIVDILSDMLNPMKTKRYVNMNNFYKQKNEEWLSRHEDYLDMVTSPDFQNPQSPMSEGGVILGPIENLNTEEYISFLQSQSRPIVDGGYLDVKFVRKPKTKSISVSCAPSTQAEGPNDMFVLKKREKASEEEEEESPAEDLTSLEKPEKSSSRRSSNMELSSPSGDTTTVLMNQMDCDTVRVNQCAIIWK